MLKYLSIVAFSGLCCTVAYLHVFNAQQDVGSKVQVGRTSSGQPALIVAGHSPIPIRMPQTPKAPVAAAAPAAGAAPITLKHTHVEHTEPVSVSTSSSASTFQNGQWVAGEPKMYFGPVSRSGTPLQGAGGNYVGDHIAWPHDKWLYEAATVPAACAGVKTHRYSGAEYGKLAIHQCALHENWDFSKQPQLRHIFHMGYDWPSNLPRWALIQPALAAIPVPPKQYVDWGANQGFFTLATGVQFPDAHVISVDCFAKGYLDQEKRAGKYIGLKKLSLCFMGFKRVDAMHFPKLLDRGIHFDMQSGYAILHHVYKSLSVTGRSMAQLYGDFIALARTTIFELAEPWADMEATILEGARLRGLKLKIEFLGNIAKNVGMYELKMEIFRQEVKVTVLNFDELFPNARFDLDVFSEVMGCTHNDEYTMRQLLDGP